MCLARWKRGKRRGACLAKMLADRVLEQGPFLRVGPAKADLFFPEGVEFSKPQKAHKILFLLKITPGG